MLVNYDYNRRIFLGFIFFLFGDIFIVWEYSYFNFGVVLFGVVYLLYVIVFGFELINLIVFLVFLISSVYIYCLYLLNFEGFFIGVIGGYMFMIIIMIWRVIIGL